MERRVQHTAYLRYGFGAVCDLFERDAESVLARATEEASSHADHLVFHLDQDLAFFEPSETITISVSELERTSGEFASMTLDWRGANHKRILPNLDAKLQVHALIQSGPSATTGLSVVGDFAPPANLFRRLDEALFTRRVLDAAVHTFLRSIVRILEEELKSETQPH